MASRTPYRRILGGDFKFLEFLKEIRSDIHESFESFFQTQTSPSKRKDQGLERLFRSFFPIHVPKQGLTIEYQSYSFSDSKITPEECTLKGISYVGGFKTHLRIVKDATKEHRDVICCAGGIPLLTKDGIFIINGHERIYIPSLKKAPGILFLKKTQTCKVLPSSGSWFEIKLVKSTLQVIIDKKVKLPLTAFLLCWPRLNSNEEYDTGHDISKILNGFYSSVTATNDGENWTLPFDKSKYENSMLPHDVFVKGKHIGKVGTRLLEESKPLIGNTIQIPHSKLIGTFLAEDVLGERGELLMEIGERIDNQNLKLLKEKKAIKLFVINDECPPFMLNTVQIGKITTREQALQAWGTSMRLGTHYKIPELSKIFTTRFFDARYYDLEEVGRWRLNKSLKLNKTERHLTFDDLFEITKQSIEFFLGKRKGDNIDNLENKIVVSIYHAYMNAFRIGFARFETNVKNRAQNINFTELNVENPEQNTVANAINFKFIVISLMKVVLEFHMFDNNNRLAEVGQRSKIVTAQATSSTNRVPSESRDTNASKMFRFCTVQTPEGKKTGTVEYLSLYSRISEMGMITTPFFVVKNGIIQEEIKYLTADEEIDKIIGFLSDFKSEKELDNSLSFQKYHAGWIAKEELLVARRNEEFNYYSAKKIDYVNVAHNQIYSLSASLGPFPGNNDLFRQLVSSNMNFQAVPLVFPEAPFVGTGMEGFAAEKIRANSSGIVRSVDSECIIIQTDEGVPEVYHLVVQKKSNSETCITQKPIVDVGDRVRAGDQIADGFTTKDGEVAVGKNLVIAYLSSSFCYEDAILVCENVIIQDYLTSLKIVEIRCDVLDTRFGPEKNTVDVPKVPQEFLSKLDGCGIVRIGACVKGGDIIVGKVTPTTDSSLSAEEHLLEFIFGKKVSEKENTSAILPNGVSGHVVNVEIAYRKGTRIDDTGLLLKKRQIDAFTARFKHQINIVWDSCASKMREFAGIKIEPEQLIKGDFAKFIEGNKKKDQLEQIYKKHMTVVTGLEKNLEEKLKNIQYGADLPDGILKIIRVFIACKRRIEPGDKLCGRYANKGVISKVMSVADMPFLEDGTPVDVLITPMGIMARMNIGQVFETTIGYALMELRKRIRRQLYENVEREELEHSMFLAYGTEMLDTIKGWPDEELREQAKTVVEKGVKVQIAQFHNLTHEDLTDFLASMGLDTEGKVDLYDGMTGQKFLAKVLVGYEFILSLRHFARDKLHARSVGKYSLITQQPLQGKKLFGGQRFGEMEFWATQAYGACCTMQELGTVKSCSKPERLYAYRTFTRVGRYGILGRQIERGSFELFKKDLNSGGILLEIVYDEV